MARLLMRDPLAAYLKHVVRQPFRWGVNDCATFIADWMLIVTGRDGAAALRDRYHSPPTADVLHGPLGLARTVDRCARGIGLRRTRTPRHGDVAVIEGAGEVVCAIRTDRGWLIKLDRGLMRIERARLVMAWRFEGYHHG